MDKGQSRRLDLGIDAHCSCDRHYRADVPLRMYPDFIDPYDYTYPFFNGAADAWLHNGYNTTQMNSLTNQALVATASTAGTLYQQIQTLQAHDLPIIPLFQGGANCCGAVTKKSVSGVYLDVTLIFRSVLAERSLLVNAMSKTDVTWGTLNCAPLPFLF